jgi:hypothetical protein
MNFLKKYLQILTVAGSTVLLFLFLYWGVLSGNEKAQAQTVIQDAGQLVKAVDYFYNDQNRFPTAEEFLDRVAFGMYVNNFPPQQFTSATCPQTYVYKRISVTSYQLNFCLPANSNGYVKGWNRVEKSK